MEIDFQNLRQFYQQQLYDDLMRYWMGWVDWDQGGVLNCLDNRGEKLHYEHKFVWSQGRFAWQTAHLYECSEGEAPENERARYLEASRLTARFLMEHARLDNGNCAFVLSRDGQPILLDEKGNTHQPREDEVYDYSILADDFAAYGVGEYARVSGDRQAWEWAKDLHQSIRRRHAEGSARQDYPYPPIPGYRSHPMLALEEGQSLARAAERFGDAYGEELKDLAKSSLYEILERFVQPDGLILERLGQNYQPVDTMMGRYVNPGHTLECVWFMIHQAMFLEDRDAIAKAAEVCRATCARAWDAEFGGIPQFMDREGGRPRGDVPLKFENHVMVQKLMNLWDKKLWWPHSEALYALLLVYEQTGGPWALEEYQRFHDYTFRTFPHPDSSVGEWIQIRNRQGEPEETVVALPVKDPMHIVRAFMHILDTLKRIIDRDQHA